MRKKKVLSQRELQIEKILQERLPEYVIRANVRLADVIHAGNQFKWMSGYHLDFVICDEHADIIAAVELDDTTHDTEDGKRRDANKNRWLDKANIKLIRIRTSEEARDIRELISGAKEAKQTLHKILSMREPASIELKMIGQHSYGQPKRQQTNEQKFIGALLLIGLAVLIYWGITSALQTFAKIIKGNVVTQQQIIQMQNQQRADSQRSAMQQQQAELAWKKQQEIEIDQARKKIEAERPHYERVLVKGKSARECSKGNVIDNASIICTRDHYETVLINGQLQ